MRSKKSWSEKDDSRLVQLRSEKRTVAEIAKETGKTVEWVR
jgi:hypothetical protein